MGYKKLFNMPKPVKIMDRTSSITNAFVNGIIPCIAPSEHEIKIALEALNMDEKTICCAYCGADHSEWDHFRPLVKERKPTGYISEIHNLVPSCGKCNQSKGNSEWLLWIEGTAKLSPRSRKVENLDERIENLKNYEKWSNPTRLNFGSIVGEELWRQHWNNCDEIIEVMRESQKISDDIRKKIKDYIMADAASTL